MINEIIENREVFEIEEDTVDDFDQLNQKYRKENEWMVFLKTICLCFNSK